MNIEWWAHRGAGTAAPENTLEAIQLGYDSGFRAVEFDVMLTSDGVPMLHHDWEIGRTTTLSANSISNHFEQAQPFSRLTHKEVRALDAGSWHSTRFTGAKVPRLEQAIELCGSLSIAVNLELKNPEHHHPDQLVQAVVRCIAEAKIRLEQRHIGLPTPHLVVSSFDLRSLYVLRSAGYDGPVALLFEHLPEDWIKYAMDLNAVAVHLNAEQVTESVVRRIHTTRRLVRAYTVNNLDQVKRLANMGVNGIFTDSLILPTTFREHESNSLQ